MLFKPHHPLLSSVLSLYRKWAGDYWFHVYRWLTLVQNQCTNLKGKAHVIVFDSHADQITAMGKDPWAKKSIFAPIIKKFPKFELTGFIPMDCHLLIQMIKARKQIQKSSAILRSPETISLNAHLFTSTLLKTSKMTLQFHWMLFQKRIHIAILSKHTGQRKWRTFFRSFQPPTPI